MRLATRALAAAVFLAAGCAGSEVPPAELDAGNQLCASCRMPVDDPRLAAQITAPREEPRFFDDIGCLADYLSVSQPLQKGAVLYVADHHTKAWVRAEKALFTRSPRVDTPMGSHLVAHADAASRDRDPAAREGTPVSFEDTLRVSGPAAPRGSATPARRAGEVRP
ncbi:MAG: nitrous oxide reductase accessory protein NosL [Thermoanaerobaculia bacterium]